MNTVFYTLGVIAGTIMRHIDIAVEWFADGYNVARFYAPPREPVEPRTPVTDLAELSHAVKRASEGPESHADGRTPVAGTTTSADPR